MASHRHEPLEQDLELKRPLVWRERLGVSLGVLLLGLAVVRRAPIYGIALIIGGTAGTVLSIVFLSMARKTDDTTLYDEDPPLDRPREIDDAFRDS